MTRWGFPRCSVLGEGTLSRPRSQSTSPQVSEKASDGTRKPPNRARATSSFILESKVKARPDKLYDHYRAGTQFKKLIGWLRSKEVNGNKPVHILRKEFGSLIAQKFGIFAAKEMLGHADIATTSAHYLEAKTKR